MPLHRLPSVYLLSWGIIVTCNLKTLIRFYFAKGEKINLFMPVYVDALVNYGTGKGYWKNRKSCHLIGDSVEELIEFAIGIGLQKSWFQPKSSPHFDLDEEKRILAIKNGAIELGRSEFVKKLQEIRANRPINQ